MKKFRKFIIAIIVIAVFTVLSLFAFTYYSRAESPIIFISQLLPMTREGLTATERVIETRNLPNPTFLSEPDLLTDATLEINLPALFSAPVVFLEDITAPNILYSLDAGDGIELSGDPQSPTITNTGVISLEGVNGAIELQSDNIRISTSGNTITLSADIPAPDIQKLTESDIEAFIFDADNTGTLSSGTLALDELSYTGTIPSAIVVGEYSDITGVGTLTSLEVAGTTTVNDMLFVGMSTPTAAIGSTYFDSSDENLYIYTSLGWVDLTAGGVTYTADGEGIELVGNQFRLELDGNSLSKSGSGLRISSTYPGQVSITTVGTITSGTWQGSEIEDAYISDALTISALGSVDDGALSSNVSLLGQSIETTEITDGTILPVDINSGGTPAQNGYSLIYNSTTETFDWISPASLGINYWARTSGVLSPVNADDVLSITSSVTTPMSLINTSGGASFRVDDQAGDTSPFIVDSTGKVGVGMSTPVHNLDVAGKIGINNTQMIYLPNQSVFTGSLVIGDGGGSLTYSTGSDGRNNLFVGMDVGKFNSTGYHNTVLGQLAGYAITTGGNNTLVGRAAGATLNSAINNTLLGTDASFQTTSGGGNVVVGAGANYNNQSGSNNVILGYQAGYGNTVHSKTGNVMIGYRAGYFDSNNNKLYIENSNATMNDALIYGDFSTDQVTINDYLGVGRTNPQYALDVVGTGRFSGDLRVTGAFWDSFNVQGATGNILTSTETGTRWLAASTIFDGTYFKQDGNSFTADAVLGTNDTFGLALETDGATRVYIDSVGNVGIGTTAPGDELDVNGEIDSSTFYKLENAKILDVYNTSSLALGHGAGASLTNPQYTTLIGYQAGYNLTDGYSNTFIGAYAGWDNTGEYNTFIGNAAGHGNSSQNYWNTAIGDSALYSLGTGDDQNTALGMDAGVDFDGGDNNVFIGANSGISDGMSNSIVLGTNAWAYSSNQWVVGDEAAPINNAFFGEGVFSSTPSDITINATGGSGSDIDGANLILAGGKGTGNAAGGYIAFSTSNAGSSGSTSQTLTEKMRLTADGRVGIGTTAPGSKLSIDSLGTGTGSPLVIDSSGNVWKDTSSRKYKVNIQPLNTDFSKILDLKPVSYDFKDTGMHTIGYIAEEVDAAGLKDLVVYDTAGQPDGIKYDRMAMYLLEVVKDQQKSINALKQAQMTLDTEGTVEMPLTEDNQLPTTDFENIDINEEGNEEFLALQHKVNYELTSEIADIRGSVESLKTEMENIQEQVDTNGFDKVENAPYIASLSEELQRLADEVTGLKTDFLTASISANLSGIDTVVSDLTVTGKTNLYDVGVVGDLVAGLVTVDGVEASINTIGEPLRLQSEKMADVEFMGGLVRVTKEGDVHIAGEVSAQKFVVNTDDQLNASAGEAIIPAGTDIIEIQTESVTEGSLIYVTFTSDYTPATRYWVESRKKGESFILKTDKIVDKASQFSWWIVN
ncbi:tail fiber domain-containing protein [Candidatus Roizmanbacteria bacterium]|nr:MAG: tail fiber domain-containing protein [Candidatus Roizmanbacteria bacterium]